MLLKSVLVSGFLFVATVLADRRRGHRQSQFLNHVDQSTNGASDGVEYDTIWAGALREEDNKTFTSITGTFTVPTPSGPSGSGSSAWVGIDGTMCNGGLFQAGIDFDVDDHGNASYGAWYEWYPAYAYYVNLSMVAGDRIRVNVTAFSMTSGIALLENLSNGQSVSQLVNSSYTLCGQSAEWIVEDYSYWNDTLVPFSNFTPVTFTDAMATGRGTYTPDGATVINIQHNHTTLTSVSINGSSVTISHV